MESEDSFRSACDGFRLTTLGEGVLVDEGEEIVVGVDEGVLALGPAAGEVNLIAVTGVMFLVLSLLFLPIVFVPVLSVRGVVLFTEFLILLAEL